MRIHRHPGLSAALLALSLTAGTASAGPSDEPRPMLRAMRLAEEDAIRVDGRLDEGAWQEAPVMMPSMATTAPR